jgi:hypothetical protein
MDKRQDIFSPGHHGFSRKSLLLGAVFIVTLAAAIFIDADALMEYFKVVGGPANSTLELGGIITAAAIIPLLAMGMCIADDEMHRQDRL